eukprot:TRINITY_DN7521_c0_g1_i1.p1 TRINITY_DN7521_c0_g1~~TRINITY_DN7521_c0_g1_i1.p1  ORF type:complete len:243 (+),score=44.27 TRINITY_DN7521_c0_g1_i1:36-731(+)
MNPVFYSKQYKLDQQHSTREMRSERQHFASDGREFKLTTGALPRTFRRRCSACCRRRVRCYLARVRDPCRSASRNTKTTARAKHLALFLWSTDACYRVITEALLSDDPQRALVGSRVDCIAAALAVACEERPNTSTTTFRGVSLNKASLEKKLSALGSKSFSMRTFTATSARREVAASFGPLLLRFDGVPKHLVGNDSEFPAEQEYLISPKQKMHFVGSDKTTYVFSGNDD